jgi:hypothetical protein
MKAFNSVRDPNLKLSLRNSLRAVTVEGQIKSASTLPVGALKIHLWESLTGQDWQKELERRAKKAWK